MKYKKKPVVIEAMQFTNENYEEVHKWITDNSEEAGCISRLVVNMGTGVFLDILTLEGNVTAKQGDYVVRGVNGEFYPCKPDIFEKTYERVDE